MNVGKKTAVLIVDLQNSLTREGGANYYPTAGEMMLHVCTQLKKLRDEGAQLVYIWTKEGESSGLSCRAHLYNPELSGRLMPISDEHWMELDDRLPIDLEQDLILRKFTYSAFWGTPLLKILEQKGIENVLVCGIKTNVCCRQTILDSASHGFRTYMLRDMTSTNDEEIKTYHLEEIDKYFAKVLDSDEAIRRLHDGEF